ncbi:hypothetical protein GCM10010913_11960 [Paenibacillus aceti]|uniref:Uncharacterized protein n=1 Tax=Paenibacillus aceti TaxID=1820010 RepID=A0ABQ1VRX1_9BACL|nr:hypothetical protein GCM10010913_11960 [Paenibacillus aceti]
MDINLVGGLHADIIRLISTTKSSPIDSSFTLIAKSALRISIFGYYHKNKLFKCTKYNCR